MELLRNLFLILTILIPILFILMVIVVHRKFKKNKHFRKKLILVTLCSFLICFSVYGIMNLKVKSDNDKENNPINEQSGNSDEKESNSQNNDDISNDIPNNNTSESKPTGGNVNSNVTSKGFEIKNVDGVTYVGGYLIVNKTYPLPNNFIPNNTHKTVTNETTICQECIDETAYQSYIKMKNDASSQGLSIWIASGYRSYNYQNGLYASYVKRSGKEAADTYSARAGHSEHQSGLAFDLNSVSDAFANTEEGKWVNDNCYKYGFIIRYPKGKDDETGYKYESWHLRYVGVELATKVYNNGDWITLEDYFGITSKYGE